MAIMPDAEGFLYLTSHDEAAWGGAPTWTAEDGRDVAPGQEHGGDRDAAGGSASTGSGRPLLGI
jgi:hypothetical protein